MKAGVLNLGRAMGTSNLIDSPQRLRSAILYRLGRSKCSGLVSPNFSSEDDHLLRTVIEGTKTYALSFPSSGSAKRERKTSLPASILFLIDYCLAPIVVSDDFTV